jgi:ribonuclease BN (tRNA processing enzyme)
VKFVALGVRGSTPAPGAEFVQYGGHTSCLAVYGDGDRAPRLVLDAGTGIRNLPSLLDGAPYCGDVVLTHLHWDHVQGLPFSPSLDHLEAEVRLLVPLDDRRGDPRDTLASAMSPPHFPIGPDGLHGRWTFAPLTTAARDDMDILLVPHKGGATYAIRLVIDEQCLVYLPDHALHADSDRAAIERVAAFALGADLLVHDAQYLAAEQSIAAAYGHATIETVLDFADAAAVGSCVLTHHAPTRSDVDLGELSDRYRKTPAGRPVVFAQQDAQY